MSLSPQATPCAAWRGNTKVRVSLSLLLLSILIPGRMVFADTVTLAWDGVSDATGYKIHYGNSSGPPYPNVIDVGNVTTYSVLNLSPGTYYFAVTAYDASRVSSFSNEVSVILAGSCTYSLSGSSQAVSAGSSTGVVTVSTAAGCAWTSVSNASWISIVSGTSGNGNGVVNFSIGANTTPGPRSGTMTIAGRTFTVNQAKAGCDVNLDGSINGIDYQSLINIILGITRCAANCDINSDGKVDGLDLMLLENVILGVRACP